jgi:hypothetical protein
MVRNRAIGIGGVRSSIGNSMRMQGSEDFVCRYEVSCCLRLRSWIECLVQVFLERDRMMQVDMDDEQVDGAGWRYGRRKGRRILSFTLPIVLPRRQQEGAMLDGFREVLPSVASSAVTCPGQHNLGHRNSARLGLYNTVDQVGIILATWISLS